MSTFFLIFGIILIVFAIICFVASNESYLYDDEWLAAGFVCIVVVIIMAVGSLICKMVDGNHKHSKNETEAVDSTSVDSTQIKTLVDSIYEIKFKISWKDDDGVWAGTNIKLMGRTEKNVGDTLTVKLK